MISNQKAIINNILNNQKIIIIGLILAILALLGGISLLALKQKEIKTTVILEKPIVTPTPIQAETIMVTSTRFVPNTLTVKKDKEINFVNFSGQDIHIESVETKELKIGVMRDNDTSTPIRLLPGTYSYFNKLKPEQKGTIIVIE